MTEPAVDRQLDPDEVVDTAPHAIVDEGVPDQWPALIDVKLLIPTLWRKVNDLVTVAAEVADEVHAIEAVFGVNPHGDHATVADRLAAIEARLTAQENR